MSADLTKFQVDAVSEARVHRELTTQLREALLKSTTSVDVDYLCGDVLPPLIASMVQLLKRVEEDGERQETHRKQMMQTPALPMRPPLDPLHFLAAHLMRHNPKHSPSPAKLDMGGDASSFTNDQVVEIKETFRVVTDGAGTITRRQIRAVLRGMGKDLSLAQVRMLIDSLEVDPLCTGKLSFTEYVQVMAQAKSPSGKDLTQVGTKAPRSESRQIKEMFQLTKAQYKYLENQFKMYDVDGNGWVTRAEMHKVLSAFNLSQADLDAVFDNIDVNNDGKLNFREFVASHVATQDSAPTTGRDLDEESKDAHQSAMSSMKKMREAFDVYDKNGDGKITREEVASVLEAVGIQASTRELDIIMARSDPNKNGTIEFSEFVKATTEHDKHHAKE